MDSGIGSVCRAVAFDARGPQFEPSYQQSCVQSNSIENTKLNKKEAENGHLPKMCFMLKLFRFIRAIPGLFLYLFSVFSISTTYYNK